jgi:arylsulfatase A-like enzyme
LTSRDRPPNLVVLLADDAGYADFGFQTSTAADVAGCTPNIDSIAERGVTFTQAYMSASVCSPSRAGLLTGRYQQRFGHECNIPPGYLDGGLALQETTLPQALKERGYATGLIGKWHLGYPDEYHPNRRGFDYFFGCLQGSRSYFPNPKQNPHRILQENGTPLPEEGYLTDRLGQAAQRFIERNRDRPFFLFLSFTAPHGPLQAEENDLQALAAIPTERRRKYAGLVRSMDRNVGRVLNTLKGLGLERRTLVVFSNDNGGQTKTGAVNEPLRGRKGTLYEGGIRVPLCMQWADTIPAGLRLQEPVISLDLLPTFLHLAGEVETRADLDGTDLSAMLRGETQQLPARNLYWRSLGPQGSLAIRKGSWKLVVQRSTDSTPQLFHLDNDLGEGSDCAAENPDRVADLQRELLDWEAELMDPLWGLSQ